MWCHSIARSRSARSVAFSGRPAWMRRPSSRRSAAETDVMSKPTGGVPPFGHKTALRVFIDPDLLQHPEVWAAAGTWQDVFAIAPRPTWSDKAGGRRLRTNTSGTHPRIQIAEYTGDHRGFRGGGGGCRQRIVAAPATSGSRSA